MKKNHRSYLLLLAALVIPCAVAQFPGAFPKLPLGHLSRPEPVLQPGQESDLELFASMEIDAEGMPRNLQIFRENEVAPDAVAVVRRAAAGWRFNPLLLNEKPIAVPVRCSLGLLAWIDAAGERQVALRWFNVYPLPDARFDRARTIKRVDVKIPRYPPEAVRASVQGTVYVLMKLGADGKVQDVFAERVDLQDSLDAATAAHMRAVLVDESLKAGRGWRFQLPTRGPGADHPQTTVRVPMMFAFRAPAYGQWHSYVPGTRQVAPWLASGDVAVEDLGHAFGAGESVPMGGPASPLQLRSTLDPYDPGGDPAGG